jgi:hypothetical protein
MSRAMGLINDATRHDLHVLRDIRNEFAHPKKRTHFDLDEMRALLAKFRGFDRRMDRLVFFGKKIDDLWDAISPLLKTGTMAALLLADRGDTSPQKS